MTHGLSDSRLYGIYSGMKQRCYNPNNSHYKWYGGKGITICDEWMNENGLQNFITWSLNNGYNEHLTIDRIDSNLGYSPTNCRWLSASENSAKRKSIDFDLSSNNVSMAKKIMAVLLKREKKVADLAAALNCSPTNIYNKMRRDNFSEKELVEIGNALDCDFIGSFRLRDTEEMV